MRFEFDLRVNAAWHLQDIGLVDAELYLQNYDRLLWKHGP